MRNRQPSAFILSPEDGATCVLPCGDGTVGDEGNVTLLDANGDSRVDLSDSVFVLQFLFVGGPPPAFGTVCTVIAGCPNVCER